MSLLAPYRYRLVQKLLLLCALISLVPLTVLSAVTLFSVSSSFDALYRTMFLYFSQAAADEMDLYLSERLNELTRLGQNPIIADATRRGSETAEQLGLPRRSIEQLEADFTATRSLAVSRQATDYLRGYLKSSPFAELFVTDKHGFNVSTTHPTPDFVQSDEQWWQEAQANGSFISDPMYDESADVIGLEMAVPVRDLQSGELAGIVKGVFDLSYLDAVRSEITLGDTGFAKLVAADGKIVAHADPEQRMKSIAESQAVQAAVRGESGVLQEPAPEDPERQLLVSYSPLESIGWALLVRQDLDEAQSFMRALLWRIVLVVAGVFLLILGVGVVGAAWFSRPIDRLMHGVRKVSEGDFETQIDLPSRDELGELAQAFNRMTGDLRRYMDDLKETTAAKERVESQVRIAREIQDSFLPGGAPEFPASYGIKLFAMTQPAREMGGDFYDYFMLGDHRIGLVVADVSDKGIPSALIMAITKTILKTNALKLESPAQVLEEVNRVICQDNEKCMFVTVFYAVVDLRLKEMVFVNAGHNRPYVVRNGSTVEQIPRTKGMALGIMEEISLEERRVALQVGDVLVCYTDGITEAPDVQGAEFGEQQLVGYLKTHDVTDIQMLCKNLVAQVMIHQQGLPQHDDITCLFFQHVTL